MALAVNLKTLSMGIRAFFICFLLGATLLLGAQSSGKHGFESLYRREDSHGAIIVRNAGGINTENREFSPALYENVLVFVSQHKSGPVDIKTGETYLELFFSEMDPNGVPVKRENYSLEINSELNEGPLTFSRQGDRIYFTRNNILKGIAKKNAKGQTGLKIFEAARGPYDWENVRELPFNSDDYSCMHPALSPDGKKLFFVSNMPGGYGGMDLYFVEQISNSWSKPVNLGAGINTDKNEVFPFFHESGLLFFASDGPNGFGGLDLFLIDISGRKWGKALNLGEPFNSIHDDFGLVLTADGKKGYFSSNRDGGAGKDDIYYFEAPDGIRGMEVPDLIPVLMTVYDTEASKRVPGADVRIFERAADGLVDNESLYDLELMPDAANQTELNFRLVRKKESELGDPKTVTNRNGEAVMQVESGKSYLILVSKPDYNTREVIYSVEEGEPPRPLEILLEPSNCMPLNGKLLVDKNNLPIPNAMISVSNQCTGAQQILRTNLDGEFVACLELGCDFIIRAEKNGYTKQETQISTVKIRGSRSVDVALKLAPLSEMALREPITEGTVIVLQNLYYDFNKSVIRKGEARDLEALARMMKQYPSMEIELMAYTDSRGNEDYNLQLSLRRAESAKQFLVQRDIPPGRIKAIGYGEAFLRNHCGNDVPCTEEEHEFNRRTEVKIIKIDESVDIFFKRD